MGDALIGTIVEERYLIESQLGAGAMGRVYRARHVKLGREVAIKVLRADLVCEPQIVERFEREAAIAARLQHPNLVGVIDVGVTPDGEQLMVMELAPGVPLAHFVGAPMPRARVVALLSQLLRGLSAAHQAGLVHRDLKPDNVLVERGDDDRARIVDFGIAVLRDRSGGAAGRRLTEAGLVVGTPMYMAPEQASGKAIDHRVDLFALGVIAYELLSGATPFEGTGAEVAFANVTKDPPLIAERVRGVAVDPLLEAFARKLMARRPDDRFATAHDALCALELIDSDRDAAMRLLCGVPVLEAPPAVLRLPRESDALSTLPMADPEWTEVIERTPRRSRWAAVATVATVIAITMIWRLVQSPGTAVASPVTPAPLPAQHAMLELPEMPSVAERAAIAPIAPRPVVHVARRTPSRSLTAITAPAEVSPPARDESADALAERYHAIGNALHAHGTDELWQRYRLIQLGSAMATAESREQAFAALDAIERALPARS